MPICTDGAAGLRPLKEYRGERRLESAAIRGVMGSWEERDCLLKGHLSGFVRLQPLPYLVKLQSLKQAFRHNDDAVLRHRRSRSPPYWAAIAQKVGASARQLWTGIHKV